ncbi:hypothetical protein AAG570_005616 [Ranatra chinensis]|uniref:Ribosome biogenesis regulatory protein n=1 Tax=Ranatra chinensis TaxID=642074 RepID=A0ABD0XXY9_9HEMI
MQLLANAIWKLETERVEDSVVVKLPQPTYVLPREKPVPKPRPLTKWQQFAKDKGIRKTKKPKLNWDEVLKKWVPTHGYKRAAAEKEKNWLIEIPDHADPYEDYFEKKNESKKEKVAKNEFQRLRNIAKAKNIKVPSMGLPPTNKLTSVQLNSAANIANISTASVGKFQPRLSKEKTLNKSSILPTEKRKHATMSKEEEHSHLVNLANTVLNKRPKLDMEKAVNREINSQQIE